MKTTILHITDIHAGSGQLVDEDSKQSIPNAERQKLLGRLTDYLRSLTIRPDFVVVSGDISIKGQKDGFKIFREWLLENIKNGILPEATRIIITPGNHDVTRITRVEQDDAERFADFWSYFGTTFPHAHIPKLDPNPNHQSFVSSLKIDRSVGGVKTLQKDGKTVLEESLPFLLDRDRSTLIYAFNSSHACGAPMQPDRAKIVNPLLALLGMDKFASEKNQIERVLEAYYDSLVIDAGMLRNDQLRQFVAYMKILREELGEDFHKLTKVATLHHHIGHLWQQQLELKAFESTIDAAELKQYLVEFGFDFVLHGHKHINHVGIDASILPISNDADFNPLIVISGGTVGGNPRLNDVQSFKILELSDGNLPRRKAVLHEIPLQNTGDPKATIERKSKRFALDLFGRSSHIHNFKEVKSSLDKYTVEKLCPEMRDGAADIAWNAELSSRFPKLLSSDIKYRCFALITLRSEDVFVEVILNTQRIKFQTFARIRWLVTELWATETSTRTKRLILAIGDLSSTSFRQEHDGDEVNISFDKLMSFLSPAISAGLVDFRRHHFTNDESLAIAQKVLSRSGA